MGTNKQPATDEEIEYDEDLIERRNTRCNRIRYVYLSTIYEWMKHNLLLVLMMVGVILGFVIGTIVGNNNPTEKTVILVGFPGTHHIYFSKIIICILI